MKINTSKIVGKPNQKTWAQVHVFLPEAEEKKQSHGQLMAALSFKAVSEEIEVSSFGSEIINRLQEIYYSNESEGILKKAGQSLESLAAEFLPQVELEAVIGVVWEKGKTYFYAVRNGEGQAVIVRGDKKVNLFSSGVNKIGGEILANDRLMIGTDQMFKIMGEKEGEPVWEQGELEQASEGLGALVYNREYSSQVAAVLIGVEAEEKETEPEAEIRAEAEPEKKNKLKDWVLKIKRLITSQLRKRPQIQIRGNSRGRRSALSAALILILIFGVSLAIAGGKKQKQKDERGVHSVIEEVQYKYDEAHNLLTLNPLRAKSLLVSSKERISEFQNSNKGELPKELAEWLNKIETDLGVVQREYVVESATEWFDFDMVKDGFRGSDWEVDENKVMVWDEMTKTVVEVDLTNKSSRIVLGGDKLNGGQLAGLTEDRGLVIETGKNPLVSVVDIKKGELVAEVVGEDWKNVSDAVGFGSNLYLLDKSQTGQIWKYLGVTSGLSSKKAYLKGDSYDLSEAASMAIDGSVWVLFTDGTVVKYVQGAKDAFVVAGLDKQFEEPIKIYTSPEVKNLYILDRRQTRVVVITKSGEYLAQYVWQGISGVKDLVVSETEKKIFMLTGEKVFVIELKN
ncbi:MAG: hypothetical protein V1810_00720 [Candidatus Beckwithbacteria bacterium]